MFLVGLLANQLAACNCQMGEPHDDIWTSSVCSSKMVEGPGVTRQLSSRRSKPDMAALVDQHRDEPRFIYSHKFKRSDATINRVFPVVDLDVLPNSSVQKLRRKRVTDEQIS
ncbi:hypothetical protein EG68_11541 [Paragonimus skrjabini miyazakii]|uniref:Uncharacterized protein n=1 Tax=Paragonimus skrjabini miyazakii TaxID=59628 RepID=A0A8S9YCA8_9TREM|nr:hypothetical protein EG68_11541 [Paragonimus skrjabini miyazakii]